MSFTESGILDVVAVIVYMPINDNIAIPSQSFFSPRRIQMPSTEIRQF